MPRSRRSRLAPARVPLLVALLASLAGAVGAQPPATQAPPAETTAVTAEETPAPEPGQVADPSLDLATLLVRHLEARQPPGSGEVDTVRARGMVDFQGMVLPMTMVFQRPRPFRVDIEMQGLQMVQAYDGEVAWTISPFQGITVPEELGPEAEDAVTVFSDFLWGLLDEADQLALEGIETVDGDQTYSLLLSLPSGKQRRVLLGGEDYLEHSIRFDTVFMGTPQTLEARLDDFRNVDGLLVPHSIRIRGAAMEIGMKIESVEVGVPIEEGLFAMPPPPPPAAPAAPAPTASEPPGGAVEERR